MIQILQSSGTLCTTNLFFRLPNPALPVLHLVIVAGVEGLPEPVGHPAAVELLAPLVVLEELVKQGQVGALPLLQA